MRRAPARCCAAWRCQEAVKPGMLMCREHWFMLPKPLRSAIGHTWRARQMQAYAENVRSALEMIAEREGAFAEPFGDCRYARLGVVARDRAARHGLVMPGDGGVAR